MGSTSDVAHCEKIRKACGSYGIPCHLRVTSAHKGPDETLRIKAEYEGMTEHNVVIWSIENRSSMPFLQTFFFMAFFIAKIM